MTELELKAKQLINEWKENVSYSSNVTEALSVKCVDASSRSVVLSFLVKPCHLNMMNNVHGGCYGTLVDMATTVALMTFDSHLASVTVDLGISCMSGAQLGDVLDVKSSVVKCGRNIAFMSCEMTRRKDQKPICNGHHTKMLTRSKSKL